MHNHETPLIYTSHGNLPVASLREAAVWSDVETPIAQHKASLVAAFGAMKEAIVSGDQLRFAAQLFALEEAIHAGLQLTEIICNVEHWIGDECVRRQCNIKKLTGEAARGDAAVMG